MARTLLRVTGTVQGVGFRPFVYRHAVALGLVGFVRNDSARACSSRSEGDPPGVAELCADRRPRRPRRWPGVESVHGRRRVDARRSDATTSASSRATRVGMPDVPGERRHRHVRRVPGRGGRSGRPPLPLPVHQLHQLRAPLHHRAVASRTTGATTTMAGFSMCAACQAEYDDPADRRFHAQPNACPECGPRRDLARPAGRPAGRRRRRARTPPSRRSRTGRSSAVKGIGGYHLAVDATTRSCRRAPAAQGTRRQAVRGHGGRRSTRRRRSVDCSTPGPGAPDVAAPPDRARRHARRRRPDRATRSRPGCPSSV